MWGEGLKNKQVTTIFNTHSIIKYQNEVFGTYKPFPLLWIWKIRK